MSACPNCGKSGWEDKPDHECYACGFKKPEIKKLDDAYLIFCKECRCHYLSDDGSCPTHGKKSVEKVKLPV